MAKLKLSPAGMQDQLLDFKSVREKLASELAAMPDQNSAGAEMLKSKLFELDQSIYSIEQGLEKLENARSIQEINAALQKVKELITGPDYDSAAYIISADEFVFIKDYSATREKQNVLLQRYDSTKFAVFLANEVKVSIAQLPPMKIKDLYSKCDRSYQMMRYSTDAELWGDNKAYLPISKMEKYFINNMRLTTEEEDAACIEIFECLMYSLSGGKKENQDHIEQWLLHKVINFDKSVTTPDIVIVGHVGGNGKGILQAICKLLLTSSLVGKANVKTLNGNFNAIMVGKAIVFFDDQDSKEIPLEVIKQLSGSDTMIIEEKGKDQYEGEKTHSSGFFSQTPPFALTPAGQEGGVDRRFSIMRTSITLIESFQKMFKEKHNTELSVEQCKDMLEEIVGKILLNRVKIANWFKYLQKKHPQVDRKFTLKALHGEDYKYFLERQTTTIQTVWSKLVLPTLKEKGCVPMFVIKEVMRHLDGGKVTNEKTILKQLMELGSQCKIEINHPKIRAALRFNKDDVIKQCAVICTKDPKKFTDKGFDWSLVSNMPYKAVPKGEDIIDEDNFVFNVEVDELEGFDETATKTTAASLRKAPKNDLFETMFEDEDEYDELA